MRSAISMESSRGLLAAAASHHQKYTGEQHDRAATARGTHLWYHGRRGSRDAGSEQAQQKQDSHYDHLSTTNLERDRS